MNGHRMKSRPEPTKPDPFYGYDSELSGIDWDCDQDAQESTKLEKTKRKFKRGDYRLTAKGHVILSTVIPFSISLILIIFMIGSKDESLLALVIFANAMVSSSLCLMGFSMGITEEKGLMQEIPPWIVICALILAIPSLIIAAIFIAWSVSIEKVEGIAPSEEAVEDWIGDRPPGGRYS